MAQTEIENRQKQLTKKQSQLEKIQSREPFVWFKLDSDQQQLEQLANKMEKFEKQSSNKLSGGTIALIVVGCLLGGGLIASLFWFIFYKKK